MPEISSKQNRAVWAGMAPYALALCFALLSLRGARHDSFYDYDAPKHAMNGAFVRDLIRNGQFTRPIQYAKEYYSRLPGLSMPYHPPMFPVMEGLTFLIFGVNVWTARLLMAAFIAGCVVLFYRLVMHTIHSRLVALGAVTALFSSSYAINLSSEPMLEFPVLLLILWALYYLRDFDNGFPLRRGLAFGVISGAALWTKQPAVLLGAVPFFYVLFSGRWRLVREKTIWISSLLLAFAIAGLLALMLPFHGTGTTRNIPAPVYWADNLTHHIGFYARSFYKAIGPVVLAVIVLCAAWAILARGWRRRYPSINLYLAWAAATGVVLLMVGQYDDRYLFLIYPPLLVIAFTAIIDLCRWLWGADKVWYVPASIAVILLLRGCLLPVPYTNGPAQAALTATGPHLKSGGSGRILYAGAGTGSFLFAVRSADPKLKTIVFRGDKLASFAPAEFEQFAHDYGIHTVVVAKESIPKPWDRLVSDPAPSLVLEKEIPLNSTRRSWNGKIRILRFTNPSPNPKKALKVYIPKLDSEVEVQF